MSIWDRRIAPVRAHWRRLLLPVGVVLSSWGNSLYNTPYRTPGVILFFGGLFVGVYGGRFWQGAVDDSPALRRIRHGLLTKWDARWKRRWENAKLAAWGTVVLGVVLYCWSLLGRLERRPDEVAENFGYALPLMTVWALLPLWAQSTEPKGLSNDEFLERLSARVGRAVITRIVANLAGVYFAALTVYAFAFASRPSLLVPVAVTLGGAMIAAGHKTLARLRKLSTQLYRNIQALERDMAAIPGSQDKALEKQDAALRSLNAVQIDLWTNVDTGYALYGTSFLPPHMVDDLSERAKEAIEALAVDKDAGNEVSAVLDKIKSACAARVDSVA
ncbi:hypothetical protein ACWDY4_25800 [Streptomyces olivaceoviridis]